eukprot:PITA_30233
MSLDLYCDKCKKVALHCVTKIEGIDSLSIDMKERTLTVIGDADPLCIANLLRTEFRCAKLLSAGPVSLSPAQPKEEKATDEKNAMAEAEKPKEEQKEEKNEEDGKGAAGSSEAMWYPLCEAQCCPPCSVCSSRPEILWPRYHPSRAPNEIWYVWNEGKQDSCTIM